MSAWLMQAAVVTVLLAAASQVLSAHGVSGKDAVFLQGLQGRAIGLATKLQDAALVPDSLRTSSASMSAWRSGRVWR